jgi:hypothetical protein
VTIPGFGSGPWGDLDFGAFAWARKVLYDFAPEIYRRADAELGYPLRRYADALGLSFIELRQKIAEFSDLRDPRAARCQYDEVVTLRLGSLTQLKGPIEQSGLLGQVSAVQEFVAERSRFTYADVGKELTVSGSTIATNNRKGVITNFVSPTRVLTYPSLSTDPGPLRWELRKLAASKTRETLVTVVGGDVEAIAPGWILTDGYTEFVVTGREQFKDPSEERKLLTLREGADGAITAALRFRSVMAAFTSRDVGRRITVSGAVNVTNNGKFEIVDVYSSTEVQLDSTDLVSESTGVLVWALLRDPELTLEGTSVLAGVVEQSDENGEVTVAGPPAQFKSVSAAFIAEDVGKLLTIHKPGYGDSGTYEVLSVVSVTELALNATLPAETGLRWELRVPTGIGDETQVQVRASSLLSWLAKDFGIEVDAREEEEWQRRWVESVSRWIGMKGHEDSYKFLAELTGYTAYITGLYRVSQEVYLACIAAGGLVYEFGDSGSGRFGSDGSLTLVAGRVRLSSPTALFEGTDVGWVIDLSGSGGGNDGLRTIAVVVDANTVEFRAVDTMVGAVDPNNDSLTWYLVRLYSENAPTRPVYDEIDGDLMTYLKGVGVFEIDKFCWEQVPSPWSTLLGAGDGLIVLTAVSPAIGSAFPTVYTVTGRGDFEVVKGLGVGKWKLTDGGAVDHYLETIPTLSERSSGTTGSLQHTFPIILRRFSDPSAVFTAADVGRVLLVENSVVPGNNKAFLIVALVSAQALTLSASQVVVTDASGAIRWKVLDPDATGADGSLTAPRRFTTIAPVFAATDVGKRLLVAESGSGNNDEYVIAAFVDAWNVDLAPYNAPTTPDVNNGSLVWAMFSYEFEVVATQPPALGGGRLQYICSEQGGCDFCKASKVYVEATTPYLLEMGNDRLRERLDQVTPKHVGRFENFGVTMTASLSLTVTLTAP